ncbi:NEQ253 [Nanoarchaeum equitans Kin4-M]|uniref:NEQ253 n=1 Tax=Nanoarchaeum equitans (strain Kin4-M) TaxID=228908 RepID=Q74NF1_NANEQ|nr:NEQ253 [Nanoarchaeum equitans Kin4-M]
MAYSELIEIRNVLEHTGYYDFIYSFTLLFLIYYYALSTLNLLTKRDNILFSFMFAALSLYYIDVHFLAKNLLYIVFLIIGFYLFKAPLIQTPKGLEKLTQKDLEKIEEPKNKPKLFGYFIVSAIMYMFLSPILGIPITIVLIIFLVLALWISSK